LDAAQPRRKVHEHKGCLPTTDTGDTRSVDQSPVSPFPAAMSTVRHMEDVVVLIKPYLFTLSLEGQSK